MPCGVRGVGCLALGLPVEHKRNTTIVIPGQGVYPRLYGLFVKLRVAVYHRLYIFALKRDYVCTIPMRTDYTRLRRQLPGKVIDYTRWPVKALVGYF